MSKIALSGNASGTGTLTIAAPNTNSDRTLTLPDSTGTIDTLQRAGNVLQVVQAVYSTQTSSSSSTFADTGLTATITPTSATSKILVLVTQAGCGKQTNNTYLWLRLLRDSTTISNFERVGGFTGSTSGLYFGSCAVNYLDNPSTTSAVTYKTQMASALNNTSVTVQGSASGIDSMSTITLMEVAA